MEYWPWHSIHNALESYWKGVLSHDLTPSETYRECAAIGAELRALSPHLLHLKKHSRVAVMTSSRSQTGLQWFPAAPMGQTPEKNYSDYLRWLCDSLYRLNVEYDVISDAERDFDSYDLLVLPSLYAAPEDLLRAVDGYVKGGGHLLASFRTGFADEYLKIYHDSQPHLLTDCLGLTYDRFTQPEPGTELSSDAIPLPEHVAATDWMELVELRGAEALCVYSHPVWGGVPAVTVNGYGAGQAAYLAACFDPAGLDAVLTALLPRLGIAVPKERFPLVIRRGVNSAGRHITFFFNYSGAVMPVSAAHPAGTFLPEGQAAGRDEAFTLPPWGARILETD